MKYTWGKIIEVKEFSTFVKYNAILITKSVFDGLINNHPTNEDIINCFTEIKNHKIKDMLDSIYGSSAKWKLD